MLQEVHESVRGFKCPIIFATMENPIYLKGCEHFFDRAVIENWFRRKFANEDAAPCPLCNKPYSIVKFLPHGREQAIVRLFEHILIVPLVTHEINRKLAKRTELNSQIDRLLEVNTTQREQITMYNQLVVASNQQVEAREQQIEQLNEVNRIQAVAYEKLTADHTALNVKYKDCMQLLIKWR
jgi:hypothetical protein